MKTKAPKPKPFFEPFEKRAYVAFYAVCAIGALCYMYFYSQFYVYADTIESQTIRVAEFFRENAQ